MSCSQNIKNSTSVEEVARVAQNGYGPETMRNLVSKNSRKTQPR